VDALSVVSPQQSSKSDEESVQDQCQQDRLVVWCYKDWWTGDERRVRWILPTPRVMGSLHGKDHVNDELMLFAVKFLWRKFSVKTRGAVFVSSAMDLLWTFANEAKQEKVQRLRHIFSTAQYFLLPFCVNPNEEKEARTLVIQDSSVSPHWFVAVIRQQKKSIRILDSMQNVRSKIVQTQRIKKYYNTLCQWLVRYRIVTSTRKWKMEELSVPSQNDLVSCGWHALGFVWAQLTAVEQGESARKWFRQVNTEKVAEIRIQVQERVKQINAEQVQFGNAVWEDEDPGQAPQRRKNPKRKCNLENFKTGPGSCLDQAIAL
jgi:hypothetical protein